MKPYVPLIKSYVRYTNHVLDHLISLIGIGSETILVSLDVSSLYQYPKSGRDPALPHVPGERPETAEYLGEGDTYNSKIVQLLEKVLSMNNFLFNDRHYLQVGGMAMGMRVDNTFVNYTWTVLNNATFIPIPANQVWLQFIDDILLIWDHGMDELKLFTEYLNTRHSNIKFSEEILLMVIITCITPRHT